MILRNEKNWLNRQRGTAGNTTFGVEEQHLLIMKRGEGKDILSSFLVCLSGVFFKNFNVDLPNESQCMTN